MIRADVYDVIVVGGGPAGSVLAWSLARRGIRVALVERESFPREKVCGDFVDPAGLRILDAMRCLQTLDVSSRLPITCTRVFVQSRVAYSGEIPFYEARDGLPPYGYIVPRHELDTRLLDCARAASATVYEACAATEISREGQFLLVGVRSGVGHFVLSTRLVVGADGTESTVARAFGLLRTDRRYIAISQRSYVEGVRVERGEAAFWFDEDLFPGYGWMFPMSGGRANIGVGILSESCHRYSLSVPALFEAFVEKLRSRHPGCASIKVVGKPRGGVVKTYGGIGRNYFDGGLLVGDAGSFVDPMTGEGITQGMESALIASWTLAESLERGRFDAEFLSQYERDFRQYFDPAMRFLELCAVIMRNRHMSEFWLSSAMRGFGEARTDSVFARVAGSFFGGLDLRPLSALGLMWSKNIGYLSEEVARMFLDLLGGGVSKSTGLIADFAAWQRGWWKSLIDDPIWHGRWMADVVKKSARLQATLWISDNPRGRGLAPIVQDERAWSASIPRRS
jgi:menaquinone-9 beta-reductase